MSRRRVRWSGPRAIVAAALAAVTGATACVNDAGARVYTSSFRAGELRVSGVVVPVASSAAGPRSTTVAGYLTIANAGNGADTMYAIESAAAERVSMHATAERDGASTMTAQPHVVVPAGAEVRLEPGGSHLMLERLRHGLQPGDSLPLVLHFRRAGAVPVSALVIPYDMLDAVLSAPASEVR